MAALQRIPRGEFVILHGDEYRNYFLQFTGVGGKLHCEAVSNAFLKRPDQLDDEQESVLENLGWSRTDDDVKNWHRVVDLLSEAEVAAHARRTFSCCGHW